MVLWYYILITKALTNT